MLLSQCSKIINHLPITQININDMIRKDIIRRIDEPTITIFNEAQEQIYILMKTDIYPRFLRDESFISLTAENS